MTDTQERLNWITVTIASGREKKIGISTTARIWGVEIDNTAGPSAFFLRGATDNADPEELVVDGSARLRLYLRGKELLLYNDNSSEITVKYAILE